MGTGAGSRASILGLDQLISVVEKARAAGASVAFANGCFDVLHVGHIRYLADARSRADILIVGVNGDASVHELKGEGRPLIPSAERAELIASLRAVDYVIVFEERSPRALLAAIKPDLHCKGTDYTEDSVPEKDLVQSYGGRVVITGDPKDHSTTELIGQMRLSNS
ncbi:MAG TPA: adenylyltransferase/cytidyltransferase family protein [Thermoanaerobaculia bacterium]|nr:adenylyltransferase/cytidyltransferase family protein [Thermoanaerobaculia bacterium]